MKLITTIIKEGISPITGRVFTRECLEKIARQAMPVLGTIGSELDDGGSVPLPKVSHAVNKMWVEGDSVKAEIQILDTEAGKMLSQMIEEGSVGFRLSGTGHVIRHGDTAIIDATSYTVRNVFAVAE